MGKDDGAGTVAGPRASDKARRQAEEKGKRLAEALRANLHRRKAQARARAEPSPQGDTSEGKEDDECAGTSSS